MAKEINLVVGCKGGVGKTLVAKTLVDHHLELGERVLAIDTDCANPGLYKAYKDAAETDGAKVVIAALNLAQVEGWSAFVNLCADHPDHVVVVDTPAGNHDGFDQYSDTLYGSLDELQRRVTSHFVLNGHRDSVELLRDYLGMTKPPHAVLAVLNGFFGDDRTWTRFNESKTRSELLARGGRTIRFPALAGHIVAAIDWERLSFAEAMHAFKLGDRAVLAKWLREVRSAFGQVRQAA